MMFPLALNAERIPPPLHLQPVFCLRKGKDEMALLYSPPFQWLLFPSFLPDYTAFGPHARL